MTKAAASPTKEQISALEHFVRSIGESGYASPYDSNTKLLYSLINDLYELEKQSGQKPVDKVEPKFKVGDWVVFNYNCNGNSIYQIEQIENYQYTLRHILGGSLHVGFDNEELLKLWTIQDAKDGDVLTDGKLIVIFNKLEEPAYRQHIIAYIGLDLCGRLQITEDTWQLGVDKAMPATKEQRDLLFQRMEEAGYEWSSEHRKLIKME
jgi:hypothetical protein